MVKFVDLFLKFMFIGMIVLSLFSFIVLFQSENRVSNQFADDDLINSTFSDLTTDLEGLESRSQKVKDAFESEKPKGLISLILFSIPAAGKTFNSMVVGVFNLLIKLPIVFLGLPPSIVSVLSSVLIIIIVLGLWAVYKLGG